MSEDGAEIMNCVIGTIADLCYNQEVSLQQKTPVSAGAVTHTEPKGGTYVR